MRETMKKVILLQTSQVCDSLEPVFVGRDDRNCCETFKNEDEIGLEYEGK